MFDFNVRVTVACMCIFVHVLCTNEKLDGCMSRLAHSYSSRCSPFSHCILTPAPGRDYTEQTIGSNLIANEEINEFMKIVCYNQPIVDDERVEESEYIGLALAVRNATTITLVQQMYDYAVIKILDDDNSKF